MASRGACAAAGDADSGGCFIDLVKAILNWEEVMSTLVGFGAFAALPEEQISEKISRRILSGDQGMLVWWSIGAGVAANPRT